MLTLLRDVGMAPQLSIFGGAVEPEEAIARSGVP